MNVTTYIKNGNELPAHVDLAITPTRAPSSRSRCPNSNRCARRGCTGACQPSNPDVAGN